jgi:hypothetical protein
MAFVNEYVSEDDIKKYKLEEDWIRRNPQYRTKGRPSSCPLKWTIDRERNIYFMVVGGGGSEANDFGTPCILNWQGKGISVVLKLAKGSSDNLNNHPFIIVWDLVNIGPSQLEKISNKEILQTLKEALMVYGYSGAHRQIPDTIVEFNF